MKALKVIKCSDALMWYNQSIGAVVPFLGEDIDYKGPIYWSRDKGGYKNIILKGDAELIDVPGDSINHLFDQTNYPQ